MINVLSIYLKRSKIRTFILRYLPVLFAQTQLYLAGWPVPDLFRTIQPHTDGW